MQKDILIEKGWKFYRDCRRAEELKERTALDVTMPHTWNAVDGQDGGNDYFRGTCAYTCPLPAVNAGEDEEEYLVFEGVNASAEIYLDGILLGRHDGGYSAFSLLLPSSDNRSRTLLVFVDNSENDTVYPQTADFTFYGGIYRKVHLVTVNRNHIEKLKIKPQVNGKNGVLSVEILTSCDSADIRCILLDRDGRVAAEATGSGAALSLDVQDVRLWDGIGDPYLYTLRTEMKKDGKITDSIERSVGFRTFVFDPGKGFLLNGRSYPLRGVSRHQDREGVGNALTEEMHDEDFALIMECGFNSVRLAHYQQSQYVYDLCDRLGLVVWAEIPYITKHMENGRKNTLSQMTELIDQCFNHPSIAVWGISNEITAGGNSDAVYENSRALLQLCHEKDDTRPAAMAHAFMLSPVDRILTLPDVSGYNLYYGWYIGGMEDTAKFLDNVHADHPSLPLGLTEFGCDANILYHSSKPRKGDYTEEYQALFHEFMCSEISSRQYLWGTYIWSMFDFGADNREEGGTKGRNNKGLVSFDHRTKKDSFYAVKAWYSKEKFVHITSKRYLRRAEDTTEVKVYSNLSPVELLVNGRSLGEKNGEHTFVFSVPLEKGENRIEARSGNFSDMAVIERVEKADASYSYSSSSAVNNWFAGLDITEKEGFYSIYNTMGDILKTEGGKRIFAYVMKEREKSRAEGIATQVHIDEKMLMATIKDIPLAEMLKRAKFDGAKISAINRELNTIRKEQ